MRTAVGLLLLSAAGALVTVSLFFGGGIGDGRLFWIGIFAETVGFGALAAGLAGLVALPVPGRAGLAATALLAAFVCWNGVTMIWSITPDRSWAYLNRGVVYVAFAVLGLAVAANVRRPSRLVAGGLAVLLLAVVGWALLGKVFPSLFPDGGRVARLRNPIGYWNALALACAVSLPLGLWAATRRSWRREARAGGVLLVYLAVIALVLTFSRAGVVVAAVSVLLWLALVPARLESFGALLVGVVPAAAVAGWASTRAGLVDDGQSLAARRADGGWFALVAVLVGTVVVAGALWAVDADRRFDDPAARRLWTRRIGLGVGALVVAGVVAVSAASGGPGAWLREFRGGGELSNSQRLGSLSSNNRWAWWQEAWQVFEQKPVGGKGANSFAIARLRVRKGSTVTNGGPHNIALQALAETGIVGFLLGLGAVVAALVALVQGLRRLRGEERWAATALAIAVPAYLLHALADIDWDFVAVGAPVFFAGGLVIGLGGEARDLRLGTRPVVAAGAVAACLLAAVYSLTAPWLAADRTDSAYAAASSAAAASDARDAIDLNPFSVDAIAALAFAYQLAGDTAGAVRQLERATRLQPENPNTWLQLGQYDLTLHDARGAYVALNNAYTLDPFGPTGIPCGPLDQARALVEKRPPPTCRG